MEKMRLGRSGLMASQIGFGALPIQRISKEEAVRILRRAYEGGINFFDTANMYTDSEEKIGAALSPVRNDIIIATKSGGADKKTVRAHMENSLRMLKTDYIDLFQFHNPSVLPDPEDPDGAFAAALEAKKEGYILHIGITNHLLPVAQQAVESGLFETLQFPFSYLASEQEMKLAQECRKADMGFIAMKGLAGGLLTNVRACHGFMRQHPWVLPIWGIQTMQQLEQWLQAQKEDLPVDGETQKAILKDRAELTGAFCRGCGYCMPCPVGIDIKNAARMNMLLRRAPYQPFLEAQEYEKMHRIENCLDCGSCKAKCPYQLDTPRLLKEMLKDYDAFYEAHKK